jgi:hypothetical protein
MIGKLRLGEPSPLTSILEVPDIENEPVRLILSRFVPVETWASCVSRLPPDKERLLAVMAPVVSTVDAPLIATAPPAAVIPPGMIAVPPDWVKFATVAFPVCVRVPLVWVKFPVVRLLIETAFVLESVTDPPGKLRLPAVSGVVVPDVESARWRPEKVALPR